jgi:SulP family sulfate permease
MSLPRLTLLEWARGYGRATLGNDLIAAAIVTVMLIPQSLAYAMLAGLPAEVGLYASMLPIIVYALFGTSRTLSVGPVAVMSLMTLTAASSVAAPGSAEFVAAALVLALLSGLFLLAMGLLRLGFLGNLLSHPVISAFITAAALIIGIGQLGSILGLQLRGDNLPALFGALAAGVASIHLPTLAIGAAVLVFLLWAKSGLRPLLERAGLGPRPADLIGRSGPILAVAGSTLVVAAFDLGAMGVRTVGAIPQSLPPFTVPMFDAGLWRQLAVPALLLAIIGFVESMSIAQTLAARRRERIDPDQELIGLGAANITASFSGGYPVTGGLSRSVVNFNAGAETPAASAFAAVGIAITALFFTPYLASLPIATLGAIIIVAVIGLVDLRTPREVWRYSRTDFIAMATTAIVTLLVGIEPGIMSGVGVTLALFLWRAARPHAAIVGRVGDTEHFRNVKRHRVYTDPRILTIRIDESLTWLNARWLEEFVSGQVAEQPQVRHVILMCSAVNAIDASALDSLEMINHRLAEGGVTLHLSEIKGPVMDALTRSSFLDELSGNVYLSQNAAFEAVLELADHEREQASEEMIDPRLARGLG